jgi:serine protease Do
MTNEELLQQELQPEITSEQADLIESEPDQNPEQNIPNQTPPTLKKKRFRANKVLAVILIAVLCAGAGFGGGMAAITLSGYSIQGDNITINPDDSVNTAEAIATKVLPSVVGISTSTKVTYQSWNGQEEGVQSGVGTGIIIDEDGYILTNSHVVNDGTAETISVGLADGRELTGEVLWNDKSIDLAIVKIEATGLTAAELGDSDEINIGSYAVAIGNPLGLDFERSVTAGVISGLNRTITISDGQTETTMDNLIQTDAAINSGNSGGPLLNAKGQVIGINSAKAQSGESLGFAIPINTAIPIIESVLESGSFQRVYLGIKGGSVAEYQAAYPDEELATDKGVIVSDFLKDSPAKAAGLEQGDIIVAVDGDAIDNMTDLITTLLKYQSGDKVSVKVVRGDQTLTLKVTLTTQSQ